MINFISLIQTLNFLFPTKIYMYGHFAVLKEIVCNCRFCRVSRTFASVFRTNNQIKLLNDSVYCTCQLKQSD